MFYNHRNAFLSIELTSNTPTPIAIPATVIVFEDTNSKKVVLQPFVYTTLESTHEVSPFWRSQHEGGKGLLYVFQSL